MNESMPFPKPSPADPLPLEEWLELTDRAEVGREPFFRGRISEYEVFRGAVSSLRAGHVGGGTMVFQGAPGAGKSALMQECMEAVRRHSTPEERWVAVSISPGFLDSPLDVIEAMVDAARMESERLQKMVSETPEEELLIDLLTLGKKLGKELSKRGGGIFGIKVGGSNDDNVTTVRGAFRRAVPLLGKFQVVVFVDEAQNIPVEKASRAVLDCLHRDPQGIPLVTAFFGLSDTEEVLKKCGLSRLPDKRVVNLEQLSPEDAASAIRGVFDAYNFAGMPEELERWVVSLAKLSQGWPQHINRVSVAAAEIIQEQDGHIRMEHLNDAIKYGQERMDVYYAKRLSAGSSWNWVYKNLAIAAQENGGVLSWADIDVLTESARVRRDESTDEFLLNALHAGLLAPAPQPSDDYRIPIPLMGDYLQKLSAESPSWA